MIAAALGVLITAGFLASQLGGRLSSGGFRDPAAESSVAASVLMERFRVGPPQLVFLARAPEVITAPDAAAAGREITTGIRASGGVAYVESFWDTRDPRLVADKGRATVILVGLRGDDRQVSQYTADLVAAFSGRHGPLQLVATGSGVVQLDLETRSRHDLVVAELVAAPIVGLVLLLIFGSVLAAAMPLLVGLFSIVVTAGFLRLLTEVTEVSFFALNVTTALGFALSLSYSLFLLTRFRAELSTGLPVHTAAAAAARATSRTIVFSALTIAVCMSAMLLLPTYFFRSLALAGIGVVLLAAGAATTLMPAVLVLAGTRLAGGGERTGEERWRRWAHRVMARPVLVFALAALALVALALPALGVRFGHMNEGWLPDDLPSRAATKAITAEFPMAGQAVHFVVLPDQSTEALALARYAEDLSALPGVLRVDSYSGIFRFGKEILAHPPAGWFPSGTGTWLQVITEHPPDSPQAGAFVQRIRTTPAPSTLLVTGDTATLVDMKSMLGARLGWVLLFVGVSTFVLLFLFTRSVILPIKALLLNLLVLAAGLGVMVLVFQDGHLLRLLGGDAPLGAVDPMLELFLVCIAFGVLLDYEIFLLSGIREEYLRSGDNTEAVATGLARNGRLITSAACTLMISVGAMAVSDIMPIKLIGVVLTAGLIIDATLVRALLVPSFMRLAGKWNWWAPRWSEGGPSPHPLPVRGRAGL